VRLWSKSAATGAWVYNDYTYTAFTAVVTFAPATMTAPAAGSVLTGSSVTFQWTTGTGVSQYWLYASNTGAGNSELANIDKGAATSHTLTNLPTNGSTVYVRLWSKNAATGAWVYNDYTYTAFTAATFSPAVMTSPANGATLAGTSTAFQWTTGAGVSQYWLYASNVAAGGMELANIDKGTSTSHTLTNLPANGGPVWVRLWSKNSLTAVWVYNDYVYTAFSSTGNFAPAVMISPANGAVLTSAPLFQWTSGTGVAEYWLYISKAAPGGTEYYNASAGKNTSLLFAGLPTGGNTYVRLWSKNASSSTWSFVDYAFR
jgi:hypothetical protein